MCTRKQFLMAVAGVVATSTLMMAVTPAMAQSAVDRVRQQGALRVAITPTAIGFNFKDPKTNELVGVNVEVAKRLAKELGVRAELIEMPFPALFEHLLAGRSDIVMSAVVIRPERSARFSFSDVPYAFGFTALVRADETRRFANLDAVVEEYKKGNLRVGEQTNAAFVNMIKQAGLPTTGLQLYENKQDAVRDLALGRLDITFWDTPIAQNFLHSNPDVAAKVKIAPEFVSARLDNGYPIRFEDKDLLVLVNKALAQMKADGSLAQIVRQYGMDPAALMK